MSYNIEVYTKQDCPYCNKVKSFFIQQKLDFKEITINNDILNAKYLEMRRRSNGKVTVPQIFINGYHIGGSDDLMKIISDPKKLHDLLYKQ